QAAAHPSGNQTDNEFEIVLFGESAHFPKPADHCRGQSGPAKGIGSAGVASKRQARLDPVGHWVEWQLRLPGVARLSWTRTGLLGRRPATALESRHPILD